MSRLIKASIFASLFLVLIIPAAAFGQDITDLGGELSNSIPGANGLQVTAPNVTDQERIDKQLNGFAPFHQIFRKSQGLGPEFINSSCGGCHVNNGRGRVKIRNTDFSMNQMVVKVALEGLDENGAPQNVPGLGEQLLGRTLKKGRHARYRMRLRWRKMKGSYPDGTVYRLRTPRLTYNARGYTRRNSVSSLRMAPAMVGLGLLEMIPESAITALADPDDADEDGISGEKQMVPDLRSGETRLGRFGFRASHTTVEQQTSAAAFNDMGVTNALFNPTDEDSEMSDSVLDMLVIYEMLAGVPRARNQGSEKVIRGKAIFQQIGCDDCHVMTFTTESTEHPELDGQTIHPFTDLLLHDMGPGLADGRAEFEASGSEWRTTPLWGLGFSRTVSRIPQRYMHDGRARSIEEAILWHAGESEASQQAFKDLPESSRKDLIAFLRSL